VAQRNRDGGREGQDPPWRVETGPIGSQAADEGPDSEDPSARVSVGGGSLRDVRFPPGTGEQGLEGA
jgi:hypothetical protein